MALSDIFSALQRHVQNGSIDLYGAASSEPALSSLLEALALFQIRSAYTLTGVALTQNVNGVVLTGAGTFGVPGADAPHLSNVRGTLVGTSPGGVNAFELSLAITDLNWTFDKTFPALADCQVFVDQAVAYRPSYLIGLPLGSPVFSSRSTPGAAVQLSGMLSPLGALAPYADLFAPWPLRLEGSIDTFPASTTALPAFDLIALAPRLTFQIFQVGITDIGLELGATNDLDPAVWGRTGTTFLNVIGVLTLGTIRVDLFMPLLAVKDSWRLFGVLDPNTATLSGGLSQLAGLLGAPANLLETPPDLGGFETFNLSQVEILMAKPTPGQLVPAINSVAVTIRSTKVWNPPIPFVCVKDVGMRFVVGWTPIAGEQQQYLSGSVFGTVVVGGTRQSCTAEGQAAMARLVETGDAFPIKITGLIPQFVIMGQSEAGASLPIGQGFTYFFGDPGPTTPAGMAITAFQFEADLRSQTYQAYATISVDWQIQLRPQVSITLNALAFYIDISQHSLAGGIRGEFTLTGGAPARQPDPQFFLSAEYARQDDESGWTFKGALYPDSQVELVALVARFLGIDPPSSLPQLLIESLSAEFETRSKRYALSGAIAGRWNPTLFGTVQRISAEAAVAVTGQAGTAAPSGTLTARFAINSFSVRAEIELNVENPTYVFIVQFGELWISATLGWTGKDASKHRIITLQLGGVTLGGIIEYLVNLVAPTLGFRLDPPWDVLNRIDLSRFLLTIDPTDNTIELTYKVNLDLVFMRVDTIGVRASKPNGEPSVELRLTGRFLDVFYDPDNPLAWNVLTDPPPDVPGQGETLLKLRYLGLGQRVALRPPIPNSVRGTLDRMREDMRKLPDPNANPLGQVPIDFAPDSQWLIGLDATFLDTLDLGIIFNDPRLYGLSIGLNGERAGSLAGLRFEILYKKITDDIGMFRIELQLPEAFRHIELGEVSITLGIVVIEIYTNGNFLIDLGFPHERDFTRSFTVQVFPFIGRGGIYFGLLNGSTSRRVPAITNGTFAPVLELGIGLAVGVGKEVTIGPLSGGIFVEVQVIFQGVLGWFNPTRSSTVPAKYYWVQGIAAIHGKLYGKVDFTVVKVSVTIEAYAQAAVVLEAYKAAIFALSVGVDVEAEVTVLGISVSFTFSVQLDVSFTVGRDQPTPWVLASQQGAAAALPSAARGLLASTRHARRRTRVLHDEHVRRRRLARRPFVPELDALDWNASRHVFPDSPRHKDFTMAPAFSITSVPVNWDGTTPPNSDPQYRAAFLMFAPNGVEPGARDFAEASKRSVRTSAHAADTSELTADALIEAFLRWSISAVTGSAGNDANALVTAGQMDYLLQHFSDDATINQGFSFGNLTTFFQTNLWFNVHADPAGATVRGGMIVALPPVLSWTSPQAGDRNFAIDDKVGPLYEWGVSKYLDTYFPLGEAAGTAPADDPNHYESFATFVFRDWCLMLARSASDEARRAMTAWPVSVTSPTSLRAVARLLPTTTITYTVRAGDTIASVAAVLGESAASLAYSNPGLADVLRTAPAGVTLSITLGITPEIAGPDNAGVPLATGVPLALGDIYYQCRATDTLAAIASAFKLSGAAALFQGNQLADDVQLLNPGATFSAPSATFTPPANPANAPAVFWAAVFFVRDFGQIDVPNAGWYAQTIFDLNADGALAGWSYDQPIPAGITLKVPPALNDPAAANAIQYTTQPGESLMRLGAALSLAQNYATAADGPVPGWPAFRDAVTQTGSQITLPAATIAILPGESVNLLAARTILHAGDLAGLMTWIGSATILTPLASMLIPQVTATTGTDGTTLADIATRFGLGVADLAGRIPDAPIFTGTAQAPLALTIAHVPVQSIDTLVTAVLAGSAPTRISAMCSRFLLAGLRLPAPEDDGNGHKVATGPATSLYDLTKQQFASPTPNPAQPTEVALSVTVSVNAGTGWVQLADATTVRDGEHLDALARRVDTTPDELRRRNAALEIADRLAPGLVVDTGLATTLGFSYTNAQLAQLYPATGLGVRPHSGPAPMTLVARRAVTYGLDHHIELQSPVPLPIPQTSAPLTGSASLWPFGSALVARARSGSSTPYDVVVLPNGADAGAQPDTVSNATFATLIPFTIHRLDRHDHIYELVGSDTASRHLLVELANFIKNEHVAPFTQMFLLAPASPGGGNPTGVTVLDAASAATFIVQTNESTDTSPGPGGNAAGADAPLAKTYHADLSNLAAFLLLLWEGSVVGGTGYYMGYAAADGKDLPSNVFDDHGNATLTLLAIAGSQQQAAAQGRTLLPFNNAAIVAPGLDAAVQALYVEAADNSELVPVATVPPGTIGLELTLPKPAPGANAIVSLFSLVTCAITTASFAMPQSGFPVTPRADDGTNLRPWDRQRRVRWRRLGREIGDDPVVNQYWAYEQALPIARFGPTSAAPAAPGLPNPALDPYRGIGAQTTAQVQLGFADVLGNVTAPPAAGGAFTAAVGYTDPLLGLSTWPATTSSYGLTRQGTVVTLTVTVESQPGALAPTAGQQAAVAIDAAARQVEKFSQIFFQLAQPNIDTFLLTSLKQDAQGQAVPLPAQTQPLAQFAAACCVAAGAASAVKPVAATVALSQVVASFGVTYAQLASANAHEPVASLFGNTPLTVPAYVPFTAGSTANSILANLRPGWPKPASGAALLGITQNAALPLRERIILGTPAIDIAVPPVVLPAKTIPLATLAANHNTTAGLLATDNSSRTGILATGFVFEMDGLTVTVGATLAGVAAAVATFEDVRLAFAAVGVTATVADIATANGAQAGMLIADQHLTSFHYIARPGDTLAQNASGVTALDLAAHNDATVDLFEAGAMVYLGPFAQVANPETQTLAEFADRYACPPDSILAANASIVPPAGSTLTVPGVVAIPTDPGSPALWIPYTIGLDATLDGIAALFRPAPGPGTSVVNLATANQAMPGVIAGGQTITVHVAGGPFSTPTQSGDSFHSVLLRLQAQDEGIAIADIVASIHGTAGYLAPGALIVCPPALLPAAKAVDGKLTVADAAAAYGLGALAFAQMNAGVTGVIASGVTLSVTLAPGKTITLETGSAYTFNTIVSRFATLSAAAKLEATPTLADVLTQNATIAFLSAGAPALLSATLASIGVTLPDTPGPFAQPMFPLVTSLRIARPEASIDPAFVTQNHDGPVERADAAVPAPVRPDGTGSGASVETFAAMVRAAYDGLWLATGKVSDASSADFWIADFTSTGISQVAVTPGVQIQPGTLWPRFFGLRPLYGDLVNRVVDISDVDENGQLTGSTTTSYQGVDVEVWARRLLADIDLFLTAPYATAVYANSAARGALDTVLNAKATLTKAIPRGLAAILAVTDSKAAAGLADAAIALGEQLGVNLSRAYDTAAILQYDATVTSPWTRTATLKPARLAGRATASNPSGDLVGAADPVTLTTAKTDLVKPSSFVTFLLRIPDPAYHRAIDVNLDYHYQNLEFDITPVEQGYVSSDWLTFVPAIPDNGKPSTVQTTLGTCSVPIPLRAYPALPVLLGQTAKPSYSMPTGVVLSQAGVPLGEAARWTYDLAYSHEHAAQDDVLVTAKFNIVLPALENKLAIDGDVATPLARYNAVAAPLWALLSGFSDVTRKVAASTLANAAQSFATLVNDVATAWNTQQWPPSESPVPEPLPAPRTAGAPAPETYAFAARITYREVQGIRYFDTYTLAAQQAQPGPGGAWPHAYCRASDGSWVELVQQSAAGGVAVYSFPATTPIRADNWPRIMLEWRSLNIAAYQNARASIAVRRNARLLGETGPATAAGFLYQSPTIEAPSIVTPLLNWPQDFDITPLGASVATALTAAFNALFDNQLGLPATIGIAFGLELVPAPSPQDDALVRYLPVSLYPNQPLTTGTGAAIEAAIDHWRDLNPPAGPGGRYAFSLSVDSQLSTAKQPLLTLARLVYRVTS